ncbi:AbrB family transcriptional regulator [Polynucleobacter sp. JS-Safj-400b-B2]|uniref:antitoxin n=1 Tax=Polynucleobacter sp. JS-Safj-400b-B2 TaxID=2576921 RepID=UPI001C0B275C|nr:type II toxin-antitoxin system VapB family antitoxin [Polynucleobacter sp. JS-Safj-400b-B2]MBU3625064.1 AbrB family transcriptional regulator [Polynucleobacter sp. JS-Safj-400b-B2]
MTSIAKLFMSGRSQAIRLPAKLRFTAKQVRIEQVGNALWVTPDDEREHNLGQWLSSFYEQTEPLPEDFLEHRDDLPAQERDWT